MRPLRRTETPIAADARFAPPNCIVERRAKKRAFRCEVAHTSPPTEDANGRTGSSTAVSVTKAARDPPSIRAYLLLSPGVILLAGAPFGARHRTSCHHKPPPAYSSARTRAVP